MKKRLPYKNRPCRDCPLRKDSMKGWLGQERMTEIVNSSTFVCHKTLTRKRLQCAGHMILLKEENEFVRTAKQLGKALLLEGEGTIFPDKKSCIEHHS